MAETYPTAGPDAPPVGVWELASSWPIGRRSITRMSGLHLEAVLLIAVRREPTPVARARRAAHPERIAR